MRRKAIIQSFVTFVKTDVIDGFDESFRRHAVLLYTVIYARMQAVVVAVRNQTQSAQENVLWELRKCKKERHASICMKRHRMAN
jgi:hypothetical protein